ncbi:MAG: 16S rRNA (adenine(1518)-N(6)/adenine(1519)-N(6))-dimethyltransferase RsmA [Holosporales bacterium]|jgi:16S rRNA (adenine1518-N6/adenine1519-N6)-dimethyltransferase|nr:16S rRNA (adenine(1518)-N(6)/adenine(1519)-N(6))-dimethyltransferase RsmA [Holosporales bacterium]
MDNDSGLTIAQLVKKYGLLNDKKRSKSLGQHFLCDESLLRRIVACALPLGDNDIVEVGPGPCGLTRAIMDVAGDRHIFCIEKDPLLRQFHENIFSKSAPNINFIYEDALHIKPQSLTNRDVTIISNLPYNVGTKILLNWLLDLNKINKMVLMFQKEVADRICAKVGTKEYGRLSIISQLLCKTEKMFNVSNSAFYPHPQVTSTVVKLIPKMVTIKDIKALERFTAICFSQRRKTIYSILKTHYKYNVEETLNSCDIQKMSRPENITPEKFLELSQRFHYANF